MRYLTIEQYEALVEIAKTDPRVKASLEMWERMNIRVEDARSVLELRKQEYARMEDGLVGILDEYKQGA